MPHLIAAGRNLNLFSLEVAGTSFARAFELTEEFKLDPDPALMGELFQDGSRSSSGAPNSGGS
ncbi:hypothetical protein ACFQFQ_15585 [Sulfitobacter porphyrae]|uniref:Uncharacterized protein n=1 Tax=Sulfitobacter porphyrae TaxID=1246864 RepID=A0ABW2B5W2_9RHOB